MQSNLTEDYFEKPELLVERIQGGESGLREALIDMNRVTIATIVSRIIHAAAYGRDEFSVALSAFNEAIDSFDPVKGQSFLCFAELVVNRRVIDYIRKNRKHERVYPFTYFETDKKDGVLEKYADDHPDILIENIEVKEEILLFEKQLTAFGIKLSDLVRTSPRHLDTRQLCIALARQVAGSQELFFRLQNTGRLPVGDLSQRFKVSRKTVDKHRKYIIALCIILTGKLETIQGYIDFLPEKTIEPERQLNLEGNGDYCD